MGVTKFLILLLTVSMIILSYSQNINKKIINKEDKPFIEFYKSTMYSIDTTGINQMIQASRTYIFKNLTQIFDTSILFKNNNTTNTITAQNIEQRGNKYYLNDNIIIKNSNGLSIKTQHLIYDKQKKAFYNNDYFYITYLENNLDGYNLFYNIETENFKANKIHFHINTKE